MQKTLVLIKPDAVRRRFIGRIISRFEDRGLLIRAMKMMKMNRAGARRFYEIHKGKPFYEPLVEFMTSGPVIALVLEGKQAVEVVRGMLGSTEGSAAEPGTIRGDLALSNRYNLVHASDSPESFQREFDVLLSTDDIIRGVEPEPLVTFEQEE